MSNEQIVRKIENGEDVSVSQLGKVLLGILQKQDDNFHDFARMTMAEFERVHSRMDGIQTGLRNTEERLILKIEVSHGVTNRRTDWLESKIEKLA